MVIAKRLGWHAAILASKEGAASRRVKRFDRRPGGHRLARRHDGIAGRSCRRATSRAGRAASERGRWGLEACRWQNVLCTAFAWPPIDCRC